MTEAEGRKKEITETRRPITAVPVTFDYILSSFIIKTCGLSHECPVLTWNLSVSQEHLCRVHMGEGGGAEPQPRTEQSCVSVNRSKSKSGILTKVKDKKHVREDEENLQGQECEERGSQ